MVAAMHRSKPDRDLVTKPLGPEKRLFEVKPSNGTIDMTTLLFILLGLNTIAVAVVWVLYRRARRAQKRRRVEAPNSEYRSLYVMDLEAKDRWESLDLSLLHEVNREEMEKVLAKLRATNVRALSSTERAFLDRMVEAEDRARKTARRRGRQGDSSLPATGAS